MAKLALLGGKPVFGKNHSWPRWPVATPADERRVLAALRGGQWGIGSPCTRRFARKFADSLGARFALPVGTGTAALELAVKALGIGPGDEVIIPAYTFVATATCVLEMGATPVFADIHPDTFNIDPGSVRGLITARTKAVIPVHFGGNPCDMAALKKLARGKGIEIIEDAAHAHGMVYRGRPGGTIGRVGCFSFQSSKNMASGEGGALVTDDEDLYALADSYHSFGRLPARAWYEHYTISWNHRMTAMQSALLLGQLSRLESQTRRRYSNGCLLNEALAQLPGQRPQKHGDLRSNTRRSWHVYMWRFDAGTVGIDRETFLEALQAEGVRAAAGYPIPLQENAMFREGRFWHSQRLGGKRRRKGEPDYTTAQTPVAKAICADALWLPQADLLAPARDVKRIADAVAKVIEGADELRARARRRAGRNR